MEDSLFVAKYLEILETVYHSTDRDDFARAMKQPITLTEYLKKNKDILEYLDNIIFLIENNIEPLLNVSLCNAWMNMNKKNKTTVIGLFKELQPLTGFVRIVRQSTDSNAELRKTLKKKSHSKNFKKVPSNISEIEKVKKAFRNVAGAEVVNNLIDGLVGGLKSPSDTDYVPNPEIESHLNQLNGVLPDGVDIDPKIKQLASTMTERFAPQLESAGADEMELLNVAKKLLKKYQKKSAS